MKVKSLFSNLIYGQQYIIDCSDIKGSLSYESGIKSYNNPFPIAYANFEIDCFFASNNILFIKLRSKRNDN